MIFAHPGQRATALKAYLETTVLNAFFSAAGTAL